MFFTRTPTPGTLLSTAHKWRTAYPSPDVKDVSYGSADAAHRRRRLCSWKVEYEIRRRSEVGSWSERCADDIQQPAVASSPPPPLPPPPEEEGSFTSTRVRTPLLKRKWQQAAVKSKTPELRGKWLVKWITYDAYFIFV